ncbi:putative RING-H2 finger protein ATL21A [Cardamine amara subsp. amara]|uniref:RING-type E3 ubiquitin transferase n=1 Tax=Cardamine amara subsp. amara TaxID=228776 RepID=A0ABD1BPY9_CARAN
MNFLKTISSPCLLLLPPPKCLRTKTLPQRLLSFNASGSPFSPLDFVNYTFLSCPNEDVKSSYFLKPIHCLGNSTTSFFATTSELAGSMPSSSCQIFKTLPLPVSPLTSTIKTSGSSETYIVIMSTIWEQTK